MRETNNKFKLGDEVIAIRTNMFFTEGAIGKIIEYNDPESFLVEFHIGEYQYTCDDKSSWYCSSYDVALSDKAQSGINKLDGKLELKQEKQLTIEYDSEFISKSEIVQYDLEVKFARMNEDAKIPSKIEEDAGFDLYASFEEDYIEIKPHSKVLVSTGLKSSYPKEYMALIKERGSTGTKCMAIRAGVMDSGFRNEWKVVLNNTGKKTVYITKDEENLKAELMKEFTEEYDKLPNKLSAKRDYSPIGYALNKFERTVILYPYSKAIAQFLFVPVPKAKVTEVSIEEIDSDESERGMGMLGSSGK